MNSVLSSNRTKPPIQSTNSNVVMPEFFLQRSLAEVQRQIAKSKVCHRKNNQASRPSLFMIFAEAANLSALRPPHIHLSSSSSMLNIVLSGNPSHPVEFLLGWIVSEKLLDEVDVCHDHAAAAVSVQSQHIHRVSVILISCGLRKKICWRW
jgi:hypothetical protein